jgi:hypothetical protein
VRRFPSLLRQLPDVIATSEQHLLLIDAKADTQASDVHAIANASIEAMLTWERVLAPVRALFVFAGDPMTYCPARYVLELGRPGRADLGGSQMPNTLVPRDRCQPFTKVLGAR